MKFRLLFGIIFVSVLFSALALSQEEVSPTVPQVAPEAKNNSGTTQWIWGEVVTIDTQNKALTVKYLDYETDQEKDIVIATDTNTSYENVKSLNEVKPRDSVSIDYIYSDGNNLAKNISVEVMDIIKQDMATVNAPEAEKPVLPQESVPMVQIEEPKPENTTVGTAEPAGLSVETEEPAQQEKTEEPQPVTPAP